MDASVYEKVDQVSGLITLANRQGITVLELEQKTGLSHVQLEFILCAFAISNVAWEQSSRWYPFTYQDD